jgi:hypothetical protein
MPGKEILEAKWPTDTNLFNPPSIRKVFVCCDERCGADDRWMTTTYKDDLARNKAYIFYEEFDRLVKPKNLIDSALAT